MQSGEGLSKTFNIPISHLDFDYIEKCTDVKELEKIYFTLKVGEEGKYSQLESFCEGKLTKLCPESRVLRKPTELKTTDQLDKDERDQLTRDLQTWLTGMQTSDKRVSFNSPTEKGDGHQTKTYPIRSKQTMTPTEDKSPKKTANQKSCKPKDYNEWSKIADNLEKQMIIEESEEQPPKSEPKAEISQQKHFQNLSSQIDTADMSQVEKERFALSEKEKGNEAFRAGDLEEADIYYCRSLSVHENPTVFNNRGLIYMKQKKWESAICDFDTVIESEPSNVKGLLRRATCYSEIHNLQDAISDCQKILKLSPSNKAAETLLIKAQDELQKRAQPKLKDGRRMVITEVDSDEDESEEKTVPEILPNENESKERCQLDANCQISKDIDTIAQEDTSEDAFSKLKDRGNELFKELKYEDALSVYNELTRRWPSNAVGYRNRAACNLVLERLDDVVADCTMAIDLDKTSHLSFYRRGKAYKIMKRLDESILDLEEAYRISPNHKQISDELNDAKALLHERKMSTERVEEREEEEEESVPCQIESPIDSCNDNVSVTSADDSQSPVLGTWEFLEKLDLPVSGSREEELDTCIVMMEDACSDVPGVDVATIEPSITHQMSKLEFEKKLGFLKIKYEWSTTIQLLVDATPSNLVHLIGNKLDGFIMEYIISSLIVYSKNPGHAPFIKEVMEQLVKVPRFCFVKMMTSDQTVDEINRLFNFLRTTEGANLAEMDRLQMHYQ